MTDAACGHPTVRGGMQLCPKCAETQEACEACGRKLEPAGPS